MGKREIRIVVGFAAAAAAVIALVGYIAPIDEETARAPDYGLGAVTAPASPRAPRSAPPRPAVRPAIDLSVDGWSAWAYADRASGLIVGSGNAFPADADTSSLNQTASMIKSWIAAAYLAKHAPNPGPARLAQVTAMIRDSDNEVTETVYRQLGGDTVIQSMVDVCGLTSTRIVHAWWAKTAMSASDAARLGLCLVDGRAFGGLATGPKWTGFLLSEMHQVRGDGAFGIIDGFPKYARAEISYKNGWTNLDGSGDWAVNCLAVTPRWSLAVLTRYPAGLGREHGAQWCEIAGAQLHEYLADRSSTAPASTTEGARPS